MICLQTFCHDFFSTFYNFILKVGPKFISPWAKNTMIGWMFFTLFFSQNILIILFFECGCKVSESSWSKKLWLVKFFYINFSELLKILKKKVNTNFVSPWAKKNHIWLDFFLHNFFSSMIHGDLICWNEKEKKKKKGEIRNERKAMKKKEKP